jgi:hypothetical protein
MAINIPTPPADTWKTVKGLIADTVGPMALLGIAAQKFVSASAGAALNARRMQQVLAASDGAEKVRLQFERLTGSATAAKKQVEMLARVASSGAFDFDSLAAASKNLQVLTKGALNSERALKQVQDAAAATGSPVDVMATAVAELYAALDEGRGVEAAADQLQRLGVISKQTTDKLAGLSSAGVNVSASWRSVESDLARAAGAASALGGTISGLQQQLASLQQQSDTRIGEMFIEGEKAGLRAAIGFQKFKNAIEEANAGPWSEFNKGINSVKESIGGFLGKVTETDAVKKTFSAIAALAVGALMALYAALIAAIPLFLKLAAAAGGAATAAMGRFAASVGVTRTSLGRLATSLKGALFNSFTVGAAAASVVAAVLAAKIYEAADAVRTLGEKLKSSSGERMNAFNQAIADTGTVRTPEERDAAESRIREGIKQSEARKRDFEEQVNQGRKMQQSSLPWVRQGGNEVVAVAQTGIRQENDFQSSMQSMLADLAASPVSADQKVLEISQRRLELERQIAEAAKERLMASVSPDAAVKLAEQNRKSAKEEFDYAETATKNRYEDDKNIAGATRQFEESRGARDNAVREAQASKALVQELKAAAPELIGDQEPAFYAVGDKIDRNQAMEAFGRGELTPLVEKVLLEQGVSQEKIDKFKTAKPGGPIPELNYGAFDVNTVSESGKIQAEISKRAAMQAEERDALSKGEMDRVYAVQQRMSELVNPLTGQSEMSGNKEFQDLQARLQAAMASGNQSEAQDIQRQMGKVASQAMAQSDPRLQSELKTASGKEDLTAKQAALEEARVKEQAAKVAQAAAKGEIDAAGKRLALEREIAALKGGSDAAEKKAIEKEYQDSVGKTAEKRTALQQQDAAAAAYNTMLNSADVKALPGDPGTDTEAQKTIRAQLEAARAAFEAAQAFAAEKGVQAGDTAANYDLDDKQAAERKRAAEQAQAERVASRKGRSRDALFDARSQGIGRDTSAAERGARAMAETGSRVGTLLAAESLAKDLEAANAKGAKGTKSAEEAKVGLAGLGFEGKGLDEIREIMAVEMQVLQIKMQQAQIDQTASQKRHQDAMQALRVEQQRVQLTLNQAQGKDSGVTGWQLEEKELMRKKGRWAERIRVPQEKEQVTVQAEAANALAGITEKFTKDGVLDQKGMDEAISKLPDGVRQAVQALQSGGGPMDAKSLNAQAQALTTRRNQLESQLAAAGASGQGADEIREELGKVTNQIAQNNANRALSRDQAVRNQRIAMLETQEQFGSAEQRAAAKAERKRLQDEGTMRSKKQDYMDNQGMDEKEAGALAKAETERDRLVSDMNEAGTARVDSLTAVGGGATGFMGGMKDEDQQKRIAELNEEIKGILQTIEKNSQTQMELSRRVIQQNSESI